MDQRLHAIHEVLSEKKLSGVIVTSPTTIGYLTNYFGFSLVEREAYMLITENSSYLFTDARYTHEVAVICPTVTLCELSAQSPLPYLIKEMVKKEKLNTLGFDPTDMTVAEYKKCKVDGTSLTPLSLRALRVKKDAKEITAITKACEIGDKTFSFILNQIKEGMSEIDVADIMEEYIRKQHATLSFATIVAFGNNAAIPHHHTETTRLKKGMEILLDFGVKYENYCSDMTRTIYFDEVSDKQKRIYETVKNAQQQAIDFITDNLTKNNSIALSTVDSVARDYIISQGFPSIPHGLGHGIGLEVHEAPSLSPRSDDLLTEGMVFSIEPGIYFANLGGVRIEDLFCIKENTLIQLTRSSSTLTVI